MIRRRARAIAFACAALACAGLAAAIAGGYRRDVESQLGPLRSVVVARRELPARRPLGPRDARRALELRRLPERFVPAGALAAPEQAIGRSPAIRIAAGSYLLGPELRDPRPRRPGQSPHLGAGRKPVAISVTGAQALAAAEADPTGERVDVVVTSEPVPGGGSGRTRIEAAAVPLLGLAAGDGGGGYPGPSAGGQTATLALTKAQALRLIEAENFARQVQLIPH